MSPFRARLVKYAAVAVAIAASACGIDTLFFLKNVPRSISADSVALIFKGPATPDAEYLGMDLFYRIYALEADADADKASLAARASSASIPGDYIKSYLISSTGLKYRRLSFTLSGETTPLISAPADPEELLTLAASAADDENIEFSDPASPPPVVAYRNMSTGFPLFDVEPTEADQDYRVASVTDAAPHEYYVQFYAASYGLELTNFNEVYSDAVFLGRITLTF